MDIQTVSDILSGRKDLQPDSFSSAEWDELARVMCAQGVAPLAYWNLSASGKISALPESVRGALRASYSQTWKHNQDIFNELEILADEFNRAEIPVVVLKGACFALTIYPDIGARPMSDLDLLIPHEKMDAALKIAKANGYTDGAPEAHAWMAKLLRGEIALQKTSAPFIALELHNSLLADESFTYAAPVTWFWEHTETLDAALQKRFINLRMLSPAAQILYASAHALLKHGGDASLRWFYDLDQLTRVYATRIDWEALLGQAKIFEWGSALAAALTQTRAYFGTPIPDKPLRELAEIKDRHSRWVELVRSEAPTRTLAEIQNLTARDWRGKLLAIFALIVPSPAYMRWRYGLRTHWALVLYYPFRWWGIFVDGVRSLPMFTRRKGSS